MARLYGRGVSERTVHPCKHVALVGLSGAGKSTVGPLLAARMGLPLVDTDREAEKVAGMSVARIFEKLGEAGFRRLEAEQVQRVLQGPPSVISLGGGSVLNERSRQLIWERAVVVWLHADPDVLAARLFTARGSEPRPLLADAAPASRLRQLLLDRAPVYSTAHIRVDTTRRAPEQVASEVLAALRDWPNRGVSLNPRT